MNVRRRVTESSPAPASLRRSLAALAAAAVVSSSLAISHASYAATPSAVQPRVSPYPSTSYAVIKTIGVGSGPYGIAVDSADDSVYIANYSANTVSVIDGQSGAVSGAAISVGSGPWGVAVNEQDDSVYVANTLSSNLSIFSGLTRAVATSNGGGAISAPKAVAVDQTDDTIYVANNGDDRVVALAGSTLAVTSTLIGDLPQGVAVNNADDTVYSTAIGTGSTDDSVWILRGASLAVDDTVSVGRQPWWVAVDQLDDTVYVPNGDSGTLSVIRGTSGTVVRTIPLGSDPRGVAVQSPGGTVYIAVSGSDKVAVLPGSNLDDSVLLDVGNQPIGVAVDASGANAGLGYVANNLDNSVSVIGRATTTPAPSSGVAGATVTLEVAVPGVSYLMDDTTIQTVKFNGSNVAASRVAGQNKWTFTVPSGTAGSTVDIEVRYQGGLWASAGSFTYATPTPPPTPSFPPGPPTNVTAEPGYESGRVTFEPPTNSGSSPIIQYRVTAQPGGQTCLVSANPAQAGNGGATGGDGDAGGRPGRRSIEPASTYAEIKTIPVGSSPRGVAVLNRDDTVFATNAYGDDSRYVPANSGNVSIINGATGVASSGRVAVGRFPAAIVANQATGAVFVGNSDAGTVSAFDGRVSGARPADATITGFGGPRSMTINQADGTLFVGNYGDSVRPSTVSVVAPGSTRITRTINAGVGPQGVGIRESSQVLYVANYRANDVWAIDASTGARIGAPIAVQGSPYGVAVHQADGTVYVGTGSSRALSVIDGSSGVVTDLIPVVLGTLGLTVDQSTNTVLATSGGFNRLTVIDGATKSVTHELAVGTFPIGVAVDEEGTNKGLIYTANSSANTVSVVAMVRPRVTPTAGQAGSTAAIVLHVDNLAPGYRMDTSAIPRVTFNGVAATGLTRGEGNTWTVTVPPGTGTAPVVVEFKGGLKASAGAFTYQAAPAPISCTVPGLTPGIEYTFTVEAQNNSGWGQSSTPSNGVVPFGPARSTFTTPGLYECTVVGGGSGGDGGSEVSVPPTVSFTVKGGKGGFGNQGRTPNAGGFGASLSGSFDAPVGTTIFLTVGSNGLDAVARSGGPSTGGGGGGYSAISLSRTSAPIVVAGGGGGGSNYESGSESAGAQGGQCRPPQHEVWGRQRRLHRERGRPWWHGCDPR